MIISNVDLQRLAYRKLPRMFYDYVEGGSYDEEGVIHNVDSLSNVKLVTHVCAPWNKMKMDRTITGQMSSLPLYLSPCGLTGMLRANGEALAAQAAIDMNIPYCYSMMSITHLRDIPNPRKWGKLWFQIYPLLDKKIMSRLMWLANEANCSALVLTLDVPILAQRNRDLRNGLSVPPRFKLDHIFQLIKHPSWVFNMLTAKSVTYATLASCVEEQRIDSLSRWVVSQQDSTWDWDDVAWVREQWRGKLIIKGIMSPLDAVEAKERGADAIIISNHGGRQLSAAPAPVEMLPLIKDVLPHAELLIDGGVTTGMDAVKLLSMGASSVGIGRAYLYGLAALGYDGVIKALQIMEREMIVTNILTGWKTESVLH